MFKLLTEEERQKVAREYIVRRTVVILGILSIVLIVAVVGLMPSFTLSNARQNEVAERMKIADNFTLEGDEVNLQNWLVSINNKLEILSPSLDTDRPSEFIDKVLGQNRAGIVIDGFSWRKDGDSIDLSVSGVASSRQALVAFEDSLSSSDYFSEVSLPISNLAQDRNINFQVRFALGSSQTP